MPNINLIYYLIAGSVFGILALKTGIPAAPLAGALIGASILSISGKFDILLAGGQDHLKGKIFRVGHLGYVNDRDIITIISAISNTLLSLGKISAQQAGEALVVVSKYLEEN